MPLEPTLEEQQALADTLVRVRGRMTSRELVAGFLVGAGFIAAAAGLWLLNPPDSVAIVPGLACMLVMALATRVRFHTPFGFTVPTQLGFVPLLFAIPVSAVPLAVLIALVAGRLPDVLKGEAPAGRLLQEPANAWFSIGPVAVFTIANVDPSHASTALLLTALAAQFVVDFAANALRDAIARDGTTLVVQLRETWIYAIDAALSVVGFLAAADIGTRTVSVFAFIPLLAIFALFARERRERLHGLLELNDAYHGIALMLGDVVEADDGYTGEHCRSVVELALAVADRLELSPERRRNLEFGALLHDVGKIAIPKVIVNKPGALDPEEWEIMKTHTVEGQRMLERVGGFMSEVGLIVRSHHERWDGGGYPDGLAGEATPLEARIITCCDSWNAMRTDRVYRDALPHEIAVAELVSGAGLQFDPGVVEVLLPIVEAAAGRERHAAPAREALPAPSFQDAPVAA
jgi:putative nucleotidyltransferase with HDIG domain